MAFKAPSALRQTAKQIINLAAEACPPAETAIRSALAEARMFPSFRGFHQMTLAMKKILHSDSSCIDIGANCGEVLREMVRHAPYGKHLAIEPQTELVDQMRQASSFSSPVRVEFHAAALSDRSGNREFYRCLDMNSLSGFAKRQDSCPGTWEKTNVPVMRLDDLARPYVSYDLVKIDVEGAEMEVLLGSVETLRRSRPYIFLEHQNKSAPFYRTSHADIYGLLVENLGFRISTFGDWLANQPPLGLGEFTQIFHGGNCVDFIAWCPSRIHGTFGKDGKGLLSNLY